MGQWSMFLRKDTLYMHGHCPLPAQWHRAFTMPHELRILVGPQCMEVQRDLKQVQGKHMSYKTRVWGWLLALRRYAFSLNQNLL